MLREPIGIIRRVLTAADVSADRLRDEVSSGWAQGATIPTSVEIPFTAASQRLLAGAASEADSAGDAHIGPEHLFAALLLQPESRGGRLLTAHGISLDVVRRTMRDASSGHRVHPAVAEALQLVDRIRAQLAIVPDAAAAERAGLVQAVERDVEALGRAVGQLR